MAAAKPLNPPELIQAPGLRLRRSTPQDAPAMFRAAHDPAVMRYMDWPIQLARARPGPFWTPLRNAGVTTGNTTG